MGTGGATPPAAGPRVAILHAGGMGEEDEAAPDGIDEGVALATHDLLAGVVATRAAGFGGLHTLAVDDAGARRGRLPTAFAIDQQQRMVERLEHAPVPPGCKPAIGRALGGKVARQKPPGDTAAHHVEDPVDDLAQQPGQRPTGPLRRRQQRRNQPPLRIRQICFVSESRATMLPVSGWGPHRSLQGGLNNPLESRATQPLNPFGTGSQSDRSTRWEDCRLHGGFVSSDPIGQGGDQRLGARLILEANGSARFDLIIDWKPTMISRVSNNASSHSRSSRS
jgi:hypothetical protein